MVDRSFSEADLPIVQGRTYHLDLAPSELAGNIILVGDPDRVPFIADEFLAGRDVDRSHRGFRTITGTDRKTGLRVSVISTGIGTPSLEIVLNEIVALNEINFKTRTRKKKYDPLTVVRIGTSGGMQPDSELGALVVTDYAIGLDNTGLFYDIPCADSCCHLLEVRAREILAAAIDDGARFKGRISPYAARANPEVRVELEKAVLQIGVRCKKGITVTSSGFFSNEGRCVSRLVPTAPDICAQLAVMDTGIPGLKIENIEMESSFLLHFLGAIGYRAGVICVIIDKIGDGSFISGYQNQIREAAEVTMQVFRSLKPASLPGHSEQ
jgi:uridine phosphorylase